MGTGLEGIGKFTMLAGGMLLLFGAIMYFLGKAGFSGLPGDIKVQKEGFSVYFPIVTCLVLSLLLTLILNLFTKR